MRLLAFAVVLVAVGNTMSANSQTASLFGNWREPMGSIIRIEKCSGGICLRLIALSPSAPVSTDIHNPDAALRRRPLCGLEIGSQFRLTDPAHASGGTLYDPKSGNTYRGTITVAGDALKLRGYVGVPIFGRTEVWQRVTAPVPSCTDRDR